MEWLLSHPEGEDDGDDDDEVMEVEGKEDEPPKKP
jgi:hypothetical protein